MQPVWLRALALLALAAAADAAAGAADPPKRTNYKDWQAQQEAKKKQEQADAAVQAKMAAVDKVLDMLEELQGEVAKEGEAEAQTYDKFACYWKDTTEEKSTAIQEGQDQKEDLLAAIAKLTERRNTLDDDIAGLVAAIAETEKSLELKAEERSKQLKEYEKNAADLSGAIDALEIAVQKVKTSKGSSFAQLGEVSGTVHSALELADALGLSKASTHGKPALVLLQRVPTEDYKFHSDAIIEMLEKLTKDFKEEKQELDLEETENLAVHNQATQNLENELKLAQRDLESKRKEKSQTQEQIASNNEELTSTAATLLDNQEYLQEVAEMCANKAKTWDQRTKMRADELSTLTSAIAIVKDSVGIKISAKTARLIQQGAGVHMAELVARDPAAMEAMEAEAEEADAAAAGPSFLQRGSSGQRLAFLARSTGGQGASHARQPAVLEPAHQAVAELLRGEGRRLKSTLLTSLASRLAADPFAKVKELIKELVERLKQEAANEATQKGWCDKSMQASEEKRDVAAGEVEELNGRMMNLESRRNLLAEEIKELQDDVADLKQKVEDAEANRRAEKEENAKAVEEAKAGRTATGLAIDVIKMFYGRAKKGTVLVAQRGPLDDAPNAGFDNGEAYTGAQGAAGGIVGMLEIIMSDFARTVRETEKNEEAARQDHVKFLAESTKSIAEKETSEKEKTNFKLETEEKLQGASEKLSEQMLELVGALKELLDLKPACVDTGMSYEERAALREGEIQALKKALCVLQNYEKYGPEGMGDC